MNTFQTIRKNWGKSLIFLNSKCFVSELISNYVLETREIVFEIKNCTTTNHGLKYDDIVCNTTKLRIISRHKLMDIIDTARTVISAVPRCTRVYTYWLYCTSFINLFFTITLSLYISEVKKNCCWKWIHVKMYPIFNINFLNIFYCLHG